MRIALWPECDAATHAAEMRAVVDAPQRYAQYIARSDVGAALGFAEASLRTDYVNGTRSSPVAFLEGLYVEPAVRRRGVARALVDAVRAWAGRVGCTELASDALLSNLESQAAHARLGFEETERVVCFRIELAPTRTG